MAVPSTEIDVLDRGIEQDSPSKGSFALNMLHRRNSWEVRKGFGQVSQRTTTFGLPTVDATTQAMGMRKHLGSYMLETDFGHTQCLSIFSALVRTGNALTNDDMTNVHRDKISAFRKRNVNDMQIEIYRRAPSCNMKIELLVANQKENALMNCYCNCVYK